MFSVIFVIEHVFLVMSYLQNVMHILFWFLNLTWKHYENSYYTCNNLRNLEKQRIFVCVCVCVCVCFNFQFNKNFKGVWQWED